MKEVLVKTKVKSGNQRFEIDRINQVNETFQEAFEEQGEQEDQGEEQDARHVQVSQREIGDEPPENKDDLIEFLKAKMIQAEVKRKKRHWLNFCQNQMNTVYMAIQIEREVKTFTIIYGFNPFSNRKEIS